MIRVGPNRIGPVSLQRKRHQHRGTEGQPDEKEGGCLQGQEHLGGIPGKHPPACEKREVCFPSPPVCGISFWQPDQTETPGVLSCCPTASSRLSAKRLMAWWGLDDTSTVAVP